MKFPNLSRSSNPPPLLHLLLSPLSPFLSTLPAAVATPSPASTPENSIPQHSTSITELISTDVYGISTDIYGTYTYPSTPYSPTPSLDFPGSLWDSPGHAIVAGFFAGVIGTVFCWVAAAIAKPYVVGMVKGVWRLGRGLRRWVTMRRIRGRARRRGMERERQTVTVGEMAREQE